MLTKAVGYAVDLIGRYARTVYTVIHPHAHSGMIQEAGNLVIGVSARYPPVR